jgi:hypothetical protein
MGYSLCARFKDAKEQEFMYQFYRANIDIVEALSAAEGRNDADRYIDLHFDDRLSYAPKVKYLLGYDGSSGRPYYFELLIAWMGVKSTYRDKSNEPFIYYDSEKIKVQEKNGLLVKVDDRGIQTQEASLILQKEYRSLSFNLYEVSDFKQYSQKVEDLFNTLEDRWQAFQLEQKNSLDKTHKPKP